MKFCMACGAPVKFDDEKFCCKCRFVDDKQYQSEVLQRFVGRLKQARHAAGLTQAELAEKLIVKRSTLAAYESGRNEPLLATVVKASKILNVSADWLLGIEETDNGQKRQTT